MNQVFGRFEPDETAADHQSPDHRLDHLDAGVVAHPREEVGSLLDPLANRPCVRHGADLEDAGQIDARQRRMDGGRARRKHELVVGFCGDMPGLPIAQIDGLVLRIDRDHLAVRSAIDPEHGTEHLFRGDQQTRLLLDHVPDVIWQPAVRVGDIRPALDHQDFRLLVQTAQTRRRPLRLQ